jgi:uptake hydrogenase large subunit
VTLEGERIARYRIVAPTEWNFHPEGAFARGAMTIPAGDAAQLESDVRWLVASLDPCVGVRYEAGHA